MLQRGRQDELAFSLTPSSDKLVDCQGVIATFHEKRVLYEQLEFSERPEREHGMIKWRYLEEWQLIRV